MSYSDKYLRKLFIKKGKCFTIKKAFKKKLEKNMNDSVLFAIELKGINLSALKDFSLKENDIILELSNKKNIKAFENGILTSTGRFYESLEKFEKFYEPTELHTSEYLGNYVSISKKNKVAKPTAKYK